VPLSFHVLTLDFIVRWGREIICKLRTDHLARGFRGLDGRVGRCELLDAKLAAPDSKLRGNHIAKAAAKARWDKK